MESLIPIDPIDDDGVEETELFNIPEVEEEVKEVVKPAPKVEPKVEEKKVEKAPLLIEDEPLDLLSILESKVDEMVHNFHNSSDENAALRSENVTLKTQNELLKKQIEELEKKLSIKEAKIESILEKLKPMMGGE